MDLVMVGGLLLIVFSLVIAFFRRSLTDDNRQYAYILKGLTLSLFAAGAFSVGRWLTSVVFPDTPDAVYMTLAGWIFAAPLLLVFLLGLSHMAKSAATISAFQKRRRGWLDK